MIPTCPTRGDRLLAFLRSRVLRLPRWLAVTTIVAISVSTSVACLLIVAALRTESAEVVLSRSLGVAVLVPTLAATPVGWLIVALLHALDREHRLVLEAAQRDELTGLPSRRCAIERARRGLRLARRAGRPLSIAVVDIDDFKATNDRHGHAAGDALLRAVAQACVASLRDTDLVGRWGGEEFLVVLPDTDAATAVEVLERMRAAISASRIDAGLGAWLACTASIGVATLDDAPGRDDTVDPPQALEALVGLADRRMYAAKAAGKDRIAAAPPTTAQAAC